MLAYGVVMPDSTSFFWCRDLSMVDQAADFFTRNIGPDYISHGDIQASRAIDAKSWSDDLPDIIRREMREAVEQFTDCGAPGWQLALALQDRSLVACAFVGFFADAGNSYATLDDIVVVKPGIGSQFLSWIEAECRSCRVQRIFLESGQANLRAHRFFGRHGFLRMSIVMMKDVQ